ncbi:DUF1541 domain-containing protein [Gracilibacillus oryzae]|uniref:DUF1541 domain-containing protein n=1 Tax=Gracilibacillus oryzae TaxID=1672701 RepID=A0A7C8GU97_9BACI|nr:YdhK family protein [Gracilibacillus oryzae]KAB8138025.1 DUF1541 domain-containing protein [Gracilibacillus oryzae]
MKKKILLSIAIILMAVVLAACSNTNESTPEQNTQTENNSTSDNAEEKAKAQSDQADSVEDLDHSSMHHSNTDQVPEDLANAENPAYPVGSEAIINADHMGGMNGAVATIDGAYDTTVYTVTYTPTTGGKKVVGHKWIIQEEIKNAEEKVYEPGEEIVIEAAHMEGMEGAAAAIDSAEDTTVYMVSYPDTQTGEEVLYHKWVTEDELSPVE